MLVRPGLVLLGILVVFVASVWSVQQQVKRESHRDRETLQLERQQREQLAELQKQHELERQQLQQKQDQRRKPPGSAGKRSDAAITDSVAAQSVVAQSLTTSNSQGTLSSLAELLESSKPKQQETPRNIKTYVVTKKVPVPYTVQYETRVPYPVKVPIRKPYMVYVPKPYYVEVSRPVPYAVKVPIPQPYHIEKHIPFPYKVPIDKPVPYQVVKPYPVYVEKKVPVSIEKPVPVQIKIPYDRPVPVHIPVEKPVPIAVEKPILVPVKDSTEQPGTVSIETPQAVQIDDSTTFAVNIKGEEPNIYSSENLESQTSPKSNNEFAPSPFDTLTSNYSPQGNEQKVISFLPDSSQQSPTQNQEVVYQQSSASHLSSSWSPINSSNDWIPRFATPVQNKVFQEPIRVFSTQQHVSNPVDIENKNKNPDTTGIGQTPQNQVYNTVLPQEKYYFPKYQHSTVPLNAMQPNSQKIESDGNYQFFNVLSHSTKIEPQLSGVSYQKFDTEPKSKEEPPSHWIQFTQDTSQNQHIKKKDFVQPLTTLSLMHSTKDFGAQNNFDFYQPMKQNVVSPTQYTQSQFNNVVLSEHNTPQFHNVPKTNNEQELNQNQFNQHHFPQLQQYQVQGSPEMVQYQQQQPYVQQYEDHQAQQESQYLHQTVIPAHNSQRTDSGGLADRGVVRYSQRRRQREPSEQQVGTDGLEDGTGARSNTNSTTTSTEQPTRNTRRTRRKNRKKTASESSPETTTSSTIYPNNT